MVVVVVDVKTTNRTSHHGNKRKMSGKSNSHSKVMMMAMMNYSRNSDWSWKSWHPKISMYTSMSPKEWKLIRWTFTWLNITRFWGNLFKTTLFDSLCWNIVLIWVHHNNHRRSTKNQSHSRPSFTKSLESKEPKCLFS